MSTLQIRDLIGDLKLLQSKWDESKLVAESLGLEQSLFRQRHRKDDNYQSERFSSTKMVRRIHTNTWSVPFLIRNRLRHCEFNNAMQCGERFRHSVEMS